MSRSIRLPMASLCPQSLVSIRSRQLRAEPVPAMRAGPTAAARPATGQHIATFESERARADSEWDRADSAEIRADSAERQVRQEGEARVQAESRADSAEARIRELEAENQRLRGG